jgi:pimeloyl-ACP methyl ester carboxylesterase
MPYADSHDVRIYYEVDGQGPPLLLAYGLLGSVALWHDTGYIDALKSEMTVIAFDARGHGHSDKPHEPEAYERRCMVDDVAAVLDAVGLPRAHYWGYSMGGMNGFVMAERHADRLLSLILGGATPEPPSAMPPGQPNPAVELWQKGVDEGVEPVIAMIETLQGPVSDSFRASLQSADFEAMLAYARSRKHDLEAAAAQIRVPSFLYAGDQDGEAHRYGLEASAASKTVRFLSLAGRNHMTASDAAEVLVPEVLAFVEGVEAG